MERERVENEEREIEIDRCGEIEREGRERGERDRDRQMWRDRERGYRTRRERWRSRDVERERTNSGTHQGFFSIFEPILPPDRHPTRC